MPRKCDNCHRDAKVHLTDIVGGKKIERHLCEHCAAAENVMPGKPAPNVGELIQSFVAAHEGSSKLDDVKCPDCGITWGEVRRGGSLGCPRDYDVFIDPLKAILARAHEGKTRHIGRTPPSTDRIAIQSDVNEEILLLRQRLDVEVKAENYEEAARLRDSIRKALERQGGQHA